MLSAPFRGNCPLAAEQLGSLRRGQVAEGRGGVIKEAWGLPHPSLCSSPPLKGRGVMRGVLPD